MVRKKQASTTMDSRIYELERRLQELEVRNQRRFEESIARIEEMFTSVWQQRQAKRQPVLFTDDSNGISKLENFSDTKQTPDQPSLVEDRIEETVLEREESSSQNFKKQGATTSSILETKNGDRKKSCGVKTERRNQEIWSKENIEKAVKMKGIAIKKKSHRKLTEEQPSERKGMEPHESFLGVRKGHHHRCSIGGGVINRRAVLNRRKQKQLATAGALRPVVNRRATLNRRRQKQLAIANKFKNLKPPWSRKENAKQRLVIWGNRGTVKKKCKVRGSWSPPSTSRPPDAVTTTGERPNWRTFPLVRDGRCEGGEKGDINVNTKRGNCGKKKMSSIQLPSPSELPTTVAIDKGWLDLTSSSFTQGEDRCEDDEKGGRMFVWSGSVELGRALNWVLGSISILMGQAQNTMGKVKMRSPEALFTHLTRSQQGPDPIAQGRNATSSSSLVCALSPLSPLLSRAPCSFRGTYQILTASGVCVVLVANKGNILSKVVFDPGIFITGYCGKLRNIPITSPKMINKLDVGLKGRHQPYGGLLSERMLMVEAALNPIISKVLQQRVCVEVLRHLQQIQGMGVTLCVTICCYHLSQVLLGVRLKRDKLLNKFLKNIPRDIEAAWLLFDKMLVREVTDGDIVILGYTRNNSVEVDQSPYCDLNDNGTIENKDTMLGTIMKTKITSIILMGCINITADMVEKIILSLPGLCTIDVRGYNQFGELTPTFTNVKWFTSWSSRSGVWWAHLGKQLVNNNFHFSSSIAIRRAEGAEGLLGECKTKAPRGTGHKKRLSKQQFNQYFFL